VIRHKGAPHLRSAVLDLAWYQYFLLDVIAVLALAVGLVLVVAFVMLTALMRKLLGRKICVQKCILSSQKKRN
jgi:glucuronosyltransferase